MNIVTSPGSAKLRVPLYIFYKLCTAVMENFFSALLTDRMMEILVRTEDGYGNYGGGAHTKGSTGCSLN